MLSLTKVLSSLFYLILFTCSAFSMDKDIEEGKKNNFLPIIRTLKLDDIDEGKLDNATTQNSSVKENNESHYSIETIILGNQETAFANPCLESYAKKSAMCWGFLHSWLSDLDSLSHAAETALTACTQFADSEHISIYVIEVTMIADALHKLYTLSQRISLIREKQARMYEEQNKLNALIKQDSNHQLLINGKDVAENTDFYANKSMARWYNFCATYRNIAWDQIGVLAILCRVCANSMVAFSLATDPNKCKSLLLMATLLRIGGTFCYLYAKNLPKSTKEMEEKAMDSASYVEYQERKNKNNSIAAANGGNVDMV